MQMTSERYVQRTSANSINLASHVDRLEQHLQFFHRVPLEQILRIVNHSYMRCLFHRVLLQYIIIFLN